MALTILSIGLLVFAGHFLTGLFERTKVPDVLILMLAGIILGPILQIVSPEDFGKVGPVFTTLALIVILFEGGIHLGFRELGAAARDTLVISLSTFVITVALIGGIVRVILPVDDLTALLIGSILGGTSSAVVVPMIRILGLSSRTNTILMLESAITDVLAVVLSLGLMRAAGTGPGAVSAGALTWEITRSFLLAALIGLGGAFFWSAILPKVRQFPNTVFTTIAYVLILFGLTELYGLSGAIAALTFGVAVTNFPSIPDRLLGKVISFRLVGFADVERTFFGEAVFLVKTFFFVYLGISITFGDPQMVVLGLTAAALAFIGRMFTVRLLAPRALSRRDAMMTTLLIPKGLAAAVLASLAVQRAIPNADEIQAIVYSVVFFSITLCAIFVFVVERGTLNAFGGALYRPFAETGPEEAEAAGKAGPGLVTAYHQSIGLPALSTPEVEEPNPISFDAAGEPAAPDPTETNTPLPEPRPPSIPPGAAPEPDPEDPSRPA